MTFWGVTLSPAVVASLVAALAATAGLITVLLRDRWAMRNRVYFTTFAAGVVLTSAFVLIPEAVGATDFAALYILAGYLLLYGVNVLFKRASGAIVTPMVAIGLHSFIDGFEYAILFEHDAFVGLIASIGLIVHEFAEGIILFAALRVAGVHQGWAIVGAFFGAALTTPAGAIVAEGVLARASDDQIGILLAIAAGALVYLGATHLPTYVDRGRRPAAALTYIAGVALAVGLAFQTGHMTGSHHHHGGTDHEHNDDHDHEHDGEHDRD